MWKRLAIAAAVASLVSLAVGGLGQTGRPGALFAVVFAMTFGLTFGGLAMRQRRKRNH